MCIHNTIPARQLPNTIQKQKLLALFDADLVVPSPRIMA